MTDSLSIHTSNVFADIDECGTDASSCSQICINTEGSYDCSCNDGYEKRFKYFCFGK